MLIKFKLNLILQVSYYHKLYYFRAPVGMALAVEMEPQVPQLEPIKGGGGQPWLTGVEPPHPLQIQTQSPTVEPPN